MRENRLMMIFYFLFSIAEPGYIVYMIISFYVDPQYVFGCSYIPCKLFQVSGVLAICVRVFCVSYAIKCVVHFGMGLSKSTLRRPLVVVVAVVVRPLFAVCLPR